MEIGLINKLKVNRGTDNGLYLIDDEENEVLLPNAYVTKDMKEGSEIEVFVYKDSEDRIVCTTQRPKMLLEQFALLEVKAVSQYGVFMDWGLPKDLMVPYAEQVREMHEGEKHVVFLTLDEETERLIGSCKINDFLYFEDIKLEPGQEVDLMLFEVSDKGVYCIVDELYRGLIFHSDIHRKLRVGDQLKGFVKQIREDGKVDIVLDPIGYKASVDPHSQIILDKLKEANGSLPFNDKSDPEIINQEFGISKKAFKRAIGNLYKQKLIRIEEEGVFLIKN
ncbi:MAG: S1-like domain-containing RNA-binding protein [Crocinitomicaceae bacterium]